MKFKFLTLLLIILIISPSLSWVEAISISGQQTTRKVKEVEVEAEGTIQRIKEQRIVRSVVNFWDRGKSWLLQETREKRNEIQMEFEKEKVEMKESMVKLLKRVWARIRP